MGVEDVEVPSPRASAYGRQVLAEWLDRAGSSASARRWSCVPDGSVVVARDARHDVAVAAAGLERADEVTAT